MLPPAVRALVRNTPTIAPVPHRALLSVTGSDAATFLNGIVASTVPSAPQSHFFSAFLHAQGRVLYDVFVYARPTASGKPGYLIEYDSRSSEAPPLLPMLKRYVLRAKVKIRDATEEFDVWSAWGSEKEKSWETERKWDAVRSGAIEPVWDSHPEWPWGTEPGVLRDRRAVGMGHRLLVRKGDRPQEATTHDIATMDDYLLHRIVKGVPEGVTDIPPMNAFPMDSDLDIMGALDFRKGCYVGQELTVRTYHTGVLRKRIIPIGIQPTGDASSSRHVAPDALKYPLFAPYTDIRVRHTTQDEAAPRPRPRGTGKLLSTINGVGLALLRLEQVAAVEAGDAVFEMRTEGDERIWEVVHWRPNWWPRPSLEQEE